MGFAVNPGVVICECFARDGLQHEPAAIPTRTKIESRCAGAMGRLLLRRGILLCLADANGTIPGLFGRYSRTGG